MNFEDLHRNPAGAPGLTTSTFSGPMFNDHADSRWASLASCAVASPWMGNPQVALGDGMGNSDDAKHDICLHASWAEGIAPWQRRDRAGRRRRI